MNKVGKFGLHESVGLLTIVLVSKIFYTSIAQLIKITGTAAWYATLVSMTVAITAFFFIVVLMKRFPGKDLVQVFQAVTGKVIGKALVVVFSLYFVYYSGSSIREFLEMIKAYNLPYTPPSLILSAFLIAVIVLAFKGIEIIARISYISIYIVIGSLILILLMAIPNYNFDNIFPLGGYGIQTTLYQGIMRGSAYDEIVMLAFIIHSINGKKNFQKAGYTSLLIAGIIISTTIFCGLMTFEYPQGGDNLSSLFQLSRVIYLNRFFQRVESIFLFVWALVSIITVAAAFLIAVRIFCEAFKIPDYKPLVLPYSFLTFMIAILPESISELREKNINFMRMYSLIICYGIPILVLLISMIFRRKGEKKENETA